MTLLEKINHLNLKPRNAPAGVKASTFGEWLRKLRAGQDIGEIPTALLTLYCDGRINESGGLKMGYAGIFSEPNQIPDYLVTGDGSENPIKTGKLVYKETGLEVEQKIPAKTHISLNPTGFPSWGADKTYKFVGTMLKVNFDGNAYNALGVTKLGDSFIIEGTPYPVSEFTKVG